jgi:hypothetical protein
VLRAVRVRAAGGLVAVLWADTAQLAAKRFSPRIAPFCFFNFADTAVKRIGRISQAYRIPKRFRNAKQLYSDVSG